MKPSILAFASTIAALVLPSCLQNETVIHLKKDGSGTIVEQTTLGAQMLAMIEQMSALGGGAGNDPLADMFSPEKAKAKAATYGEGVVFEKSEPREIAGNKGARTTYQFADINKLQISPTDGLKDMSPMGEQAPETPKQKPVTFTYAAGQLTIDMPEPQKPAAAEAMEQEDNPQMEGMMKEMLGDMKVSLRVVAEPGIAETDASHRDGKTITLMEMDMGKLLEKPDALKKLSSAPQGDPNAAMELLKTIDGVKMETKKKVTVKLD